MLLKVLRENNIRTLDITGGAPELNANFNYLVQNAKQTGWTGLVAEMIQWCWCK